MHAYQRSLCDGVQDSAFRRDVPSNFLEAEASTPALIAFANADLKLIRPAESARDTDRKV